MRELEITPAMLAEPLAGFCLDYLTSEMFFSHKPEVRAQFMKTAVADHLMATIGAAPPARQALDQEMGEQLWRTLKDALPDDYWTKSGKKFAGCSQGVIAGLLYRAAIEQFMDSGAFSLESLKTATLQIARDQGLKIRHAKLADILKQHRRVAHLWASYTCNYESADERADFPCRPNQLHAFLYRARWYQEWGLRVRPAGANPPLFSADELLRVPAGLHLVTDNPYLTDGTHAFALPTDYPPDRLTLVSR